jgi:hypothetical protein
MVTCFQNNQSDGERTEISVLFPLNGFISCIPSVIVLLMFSFKSDLVWTLVMLTYCSLYVLEMLGRSMLCIININCCTKSSVVFTVSSRSVVCDCHIARTHFPTSTVKRKFVLGRDDSRIITICVCCKFVHGRNFGKYCPGTTVL